MCAVTVHEESRPFFAEVVTRLRDLRDMSDVLEAREKDGKSGREPWEDEHKKMKITMVKNVFC